MVSIDTYRILHHTGEDIPYKDGVLHKKDARRWHDCGEGPWDTLEACLEFAEAECGLPWIVVNGKGEPVAYGDCFGLQERTYS